MLGEDYPKAECNSIAGASEAAMDVTPTVSRRLKTRKERLEAELAKVNDALNALESNPEVMKIIDLVSKAGC